MPGSLPVTLLNNLQNKVYMHVDMKINGKNMCAFATSKKTPVDREGYLIKKGDINKAYQRRWFLLKGNLLFYFERQGDKEPVGLVVLEGCTIELCEDDEHYSFKIVFHGPGARSYTLCAESQDSMEQWMKALACAGYDYMKIMVSELQRQLDELDAPPPPVKSVKDAPRAPPRQRYNPFNNAPSDTAGKPVPGSRHNRESARNSVPPPRRSFRDLHTAYGRKIIADRNVWRMRQSQMSGDNSAEARSLHAQRVREQTETERKETDKQLEERRKRGMQPSEIIEMVPREDDLPMASAKPFITL